MSTANPFSCTRGNRKLTAKVRTLERISYYSLLQTTEVGITGRHVSIKRFRRPSFRNSIKFRCVKTKNLRRKWSVSFGSSEGSCFRRRFRFGSNWRPRKQRLNCRYFRLSRGPKWFQIVRRHYPGSHLFMCGKIQPVGHSQRFTMTRGWRAGVVREPRSSGAD